MKRFIKAPRPRPLFAITGQPVADQVTNADGTTRTDSLIVDLSWFLARLLLDPRVAERGFEGMMIATEIMQAARSSHEDVVELPDSPHWQLLADIARHPKERAAYDPRFADTNFEFARAIINATLDDPRALAQAAE